MRLADFIEANMPPILETWEAFAATLAPAAHRMDAAALRDHAEEILRAVAVDLRTAQTAAQQRSKSEGRAPPLPLEAKSATELHAVIRATSGFTVQQLVAEYRALRASVLRLYADGHPTADHTVDDIGRFNEAIDQAIAESVDFYAVEVERWRNVFLGVLGHDLRGPLNAILLSSRLIAALATDEPVTQATARLMRSGHRMKELLDSLLDYNRTSLGLGLPIHRTPGDLAAICREEVELRRMAHPDADIAFDTTGFSASPTDTWDASRIKQALGNLLSNAAKYGHAGVPIEVALDGHDDAARLTVTNKGEVIADEMLHAIFDPLRRVAQGSGVEDVENLGLGLFIVGEVAKAHGGGVTATSDASGTHFVLQLPRRAAAA